MRFSQNLLFQTSQTSGTPKFFTLAPIEIKFWIFNVQAIDFDLSRRFYDLIHSFLVAMETVILGATPVTKKGREISST